MQQEVLLNYLNKLIFEKSNLELQVLQLQKELSELKSKQETADKGSSGG